jgi:alpha-galactosidase
MVELKTGTSDICRQDIHVNVLGLNHFTWFNKASWKNYDLIEMFKGFADEFYESGFCGGGGESIIYFTSKNRLKFDLFKKYGLIAAAGDRHLAEFMPGDRYLKDRETAESWGFYLTPVDWRIEDLKNKLKQSKRLISGEETPVIESSGEEGILLIKALCGLTRIISNVNLPNMSGQIGNFPHDIIAETNAVFSYNNVQPVYAGEMPENLLELMTPHVKNQELMLNAALECDIKKVCEIFETDPLSQNKSDIKLISEMIKNTLEYLTPEWRAELAGGTM